MTTNNKPKPDISHIARVMSDADDLDPYALIAELKPYLARDVHEALALDFDMCPIHDQDLDSCRDDASSMTPTQLADSYIVPLTACAHYWM